jgi:hypothetical protein
MAVYETADMHSRRLGKVVILTRHALGRLTERRIDIATLEDLIETGTVKRKDEAHLWVFKEYAERHDNLLCVAAVERDALVVKTVMSNWRETEP